MKNVKEYIIPFKGLKTGIHNFEFKVGDTFFSELGYSEIEHGNLVVTVELNKHTTFLELDITISGEVELTCDRCLENYNQDIDFSGMLIVKFGDSDENQNDEIIYIPEEEHEVNLSHYIYESINLSLPLKKVHPDDDDGNPLCDEDMIEKLNQHQGSASNETDPRWDGLKDLLSKN